jgi:transcriptional regulator with XRE-family HTH domain
LRLLWADDEAKPATKAAKSTGNMAGDDTRCYDTGNRDGAQGVIAGKPFGRLVRHYRRGAELTQEGLAERSGLSVRVIRDVEAGSKHRPRRETVQLLLEALEVPEEEQAGFLAAARRLGPAFSASEDLTSAPAPLSTHLLTFLIADIRGYTRFTQEQGDEAAAKLANRFADIAREVVTARGGEVIELRGDEALAVFH